MTPFIGSLMTAFVLLLSTSVLGEETSLGSLEPQKPQFLTEFGSERIKIRHGPYTVLPGGMEDFSEASLRLPCHDCLITWIQAGLEYQDGSVASADNGIWLHHTVLSNIHREDKICPRFHGDRFFASGEERTPLNICANGSEQAGYHITSTDEVAMVMEVMNTTPEPLDVVLTLTYEYIPSVPDTFSKVDTYWLDIGGCKSSSLPVNDEEFSYSSRPWKATTKGHITFIGTHLHDGGTHVTTRKNNLPICNSKASYSSTTNHIESISDCTDLPTVYATVLPNDEYSITAYYNTTLHAPFTHKDKTTPEPIMGIALICVATASPHSIQNSEFKPWQIVLICTLLALFAIIILIFSRATIEGKSPYQFLTGRSAPIKNVAFGHGGDVDMDAFNENAFDDDFEDADEHKGKKPLLSNAEAARARAGMNFEMDEDEDEDYDEEDESYEMHTYGRKVD